MINLFTVGKFVEYSRARRLVNAIARVKLFGVRVVFHVQLLIHKVDNVGVREWR